MSLPRVARTEDAAGRSTMLPAPGDGLLILCDDDEGVRTVVGEHLRQRGYNILEASSGEQALNLPLPIRLKPFCSISTCPV